MATAAVFVIGNEILSGKFADENGPFLIRRLRELGVDLGRLSVLPDEEELLAEEIRAAAARYDHVLTTGGVGPTHDDVTLPAVARAFGRPLRRHEALGARLAARMGTRFNEAAWRMAELPEGAALWWDGGDGLPSPEAFWPVVVVENVAIFPGVPRLMHGCFEAVARRFQGVPVGTARLQTLRSEPEIADALTEATRRWPSVAIGSYPRYEERPWTVIVTLEGRDPGALAECEAWLRERVM